MMKRLVMASGVALALAGCNDQYSSGKSLQPIPPKTIALMSEKGMQKSDPMLVRVYKKEAELEVWKRGLDGQYAKLKTFPICRWSGQLGPKRREGDRQTPEGFYAISPGLMNPNSSYYLSFDTGYPNAYDKAHGGTGSYLMVHGSCSSRGCYAMTDEGISEIYALARESFAGGQKSFQFQAYPFRMTAENLAKYRNDPNMPFWRNLKEGSDTFEITGREPKVAVCGGRYAFNTVGEGCTPDPTLAPALAQKQEQDRHEVAELVSKGTPSIRLVYADGGQHESYRGTALAAFSGDQGSAFTILNARPSRNLGDVSRPDALAQGPSEVPVDEPRAAPGRRTLLASVDAKPATTRTAKAADPMAVAAAEPAPEAAASSPSKSLYDRMAGVFGSRAAEPATAEPAETATAAPPVKPAARAGSGPSRPSAAAVPPAKPGAAMAKPQAWLAHPQRQAMASAAAPEGFVPGAQSVGRGKDAFKPN